jgi:hypothetical protein
MCTLKVREGGVPKVVGGNLEAGTSVLGGFQEVCLKLVCTTSKLKFNISFSPQKATHFLPSEFIQKELKCFLKTSTKIFIETQSLYITLR